MMKPEPLDWAVPFGSLLITVTTVGRSSFTTPTTSLDPPAWTFAGGAVGSGPGEDELTAVEVVVSDGGISRTDAT